MKKYLLTILFIALSVSVLAQTGTGWAQQRSKVNFKDSVNIAKGWMIEGTIVLPSITEINYINGVTSAIQSQINAKLNISDTAAMLSNYILNSEVDGAYLKFTDTATMLTPYINHNDTAAMLDPYARKTELHDTILINEVAPLLIDSNLVSPNGYVTMTKLIDTLANYSIGGGTSNTVFVQLTDTIPLFEFGAGGGNAGDTTQFTTSTVYGAFYNKGSDTLKITELRANMVAGGTPLGTDTLAIQVYWNDTLNVALGDSYTKLNTADLPINSITTGTIDVSFDNDEIPPDVWVWCKTPGVVLGRKPAMFTATLSGYKIPKYIDRFSNVRMLDDTLCLATFGTGGGNNDDTTSFTTSTIYGAFFNKGSDSLHVTELRAVMIPGLTPSGTDTLAIQISWHTNLKDGGATTINASELGIISTTTGTVDTSFDNDVIPPDVWVWATTPGIVSGRKPNQVTIQLSGYKTTKYE